MLILVAATALVPSTPKWGPVGELIVRLGGSARDAQSAQAALLPGFESTLTEDRVSAVSAYLQSEFELSDAELRRVLTRQPSLLGCRVETHQWGVDFLQKRLRLSTQELSRILLKQPSLLACNIEPNFNALRRRLELDDEAVRAIAMRAPGVLCLSFDSNIEPTLSRLETRLGLDTAGLRRVVLRRPQLLQLSWEKNVEPMIGALQRRLGADDAALRRIVLGSPTLIGLSFEKNISPTLDYLQSSLGLADAELCELASTYPTAITYSPTKNLAPKLELLCGPEVGLSLDEARARVLKFPALLGYSLERRYQPRLRECAAAGVSPCFVLDRIALTDAKFEAALAGAERSERWAIDANADGGRDATE